MSLADGKAYIELIPVTQKYEEAVEKYTQRGLDKEEKLKVSGIKKLYKYEQQFKKLGFKQDEAREKALAEIRKDSYEQNKNEITRIQAGRNKSQSSIFSGPFWTTNVFGRAISVALGNTLSRGLSRIAAPYHAAMGYQETYNMHSYLDSVSTKKYQEYSKLSVFSGETREAIAQMDESLSSITNHSEKMLDVAKNFSDPLYKIGQATDDLKSALRGQEIDLGGSFAKRLGKGQAMQFNALVEQQQAFIQAGIYKNFLDPRLEKEREDFLGSARRKTPSYRPSRTSQLLNASEAAKAESDYKATTLTVENIVAKGFDVKDASKLVYNAGFQSSSAILTGSTGQRIGGLITAAVSMAQTAKTQHKDAMNRYNKFNSNPQAVLKGQSVANGVSISHNTINDAAGGNYLQ